MEILLGEYKEIDWFRRDELIYKIEDELRDILLGFFRYYIYLVN